MLWAALEWKAWPTQSASRRERRTRHLRAASVSRGNRTASLLCHSEIGPPDGLCTRRVYTVQLIYSVQCLDSPMHFHYQKSSHKANYRWVQIVVSYYLIPAGLPAFRRESDGFLRDQDAWRLHVMTPHFIEKINSQCVWKVYTVYI